MSKLTTCKACGKEIAKSAKTCPHCGAKNKKKPIGCLIALILFLLAGACGAGGNTDTPETTTPVDSIAQTQPVQTTEPQDDTASAPVQTTAPVETTDPAEDITFGEKNALATAKNYLRFTAFSYTGLIDQLEFEGYTKEEATYGADNCGADWKEQALNSALNYLDFSAFSYSGLIDQLEFEGFTMEEATYAADNCGADWMEQAAKCAESYLSYSSFSRSSLIDQLEFEGFTHEQAVYGVEQNGY